MDWHNIILPPVAPNSLCVGFFQNNGPDILWDNMIIIFPKWFATQTIFEQDFFFFFFCLAV